MYPIEAPEYAPMRRRLEGIIRGKPLMHMEEPDVSLNKGATFHMRYGNPCIEGHLPADLHQLSVTKLSDLL